jgi:N-methylhydantoinase A/oxoprolinase/acetone carboxylase beta subunit
LRQVDILRAAGVTSVALVFGHAYANSVHEEQAARAIAGLAGTLGLSTEAAAAGIHEIVNENMAGAARVHIAERGRDPRRMHWRRWAGARL